MSIARHVTLAALVVLSFPLRGLAAPDCDGGTVGKLRIFGGRVRFAGTVTQRGATHATLVGAGPFQLRIVDQTDDSEVYAVDVPADRFVSGPHATVYDGQGTFEGSLKLRDDSRQADTVKIVFRAPDPGVLPSVHHAR